MPPKLKDRRPWMLVFAFACLLALWPLVAGLPAAKDDGPVSTDLPCHGAFDLLWVDCSYDPSWSVRACGLPVTDATEKVSR